jgi:hypothetical protein
METDLTQEEFEVWLLKHIKNISVDPGGDKSEVLSSDKDTKFRCKYCGTVLPCPTVCHNCSEEPW